MNRPHNYLVSIFMLVAMYAANGGDLAAKQSERYDLGIVATNCEREPTSFPFQGGDCVPAEGTVIVVTTSEGDLVGTCVAEVTDPADVVAWCFVSVPLGSALIVTEDITTVPLGYAPTNNPQPFEVPAAPPDGVFGGPVFLNLPHGTETTPASSGTAPVTTRPTAIPAPGLSSACTSPAYPTPALDPTLHLPGYVAIFYDGAMFVEWTEASGALSGTLYWTGPGDENPDESKSVNAGFTGVLADNRITLTIPQGLGFATTVSGLLDDGSLTLYFTDDNGNPTPAVLHSGTLAEYDQAVRALRLEVDQVVACAQEEGATATSIAAQQNAVYDANAALDDALVRLSDDVAWLAQDTDFTGLLDGYSTDWADMQDDDEAMRGEAEVVPFDCFQLTNVEFALTELEYDVTEFEFNDTNLEYAVDTVNGDIGAVEQDIEDVRAAFDALQTAVAANMTGEPEPWFTQDDVDQAVSAAQEQIDASKTAIETVQTQAQDYDQKAAELLKEAQDFVAGLTCSG